VNYNHFPDGLKMNKVAFLKESLTYIFSLCLIIFFFQDGKLDLIELCVLCTLFPIYILISCLCFSYKVENENIIMTDEEIAAANSERNIIDEDIVNNKEDKHKK